MEKISKGKRNRLRLCPFVFLLKVPYNVSLEETLNSFRRARRHAWHCSPKRAIKLQILCKFAFKEALFPGLFLCLRLPWPIKISFSVTHRIKGWHQIRWKASFSQAVCRGPGSRSILFALPVTSDADYEWQNACAHVRECVHRSAHLHDELADNHGTITDSDKMKEELEHQPLEKGHPLSQGKCSD